MDPLRVGSFAFNEWLQLQLKARKLTQRQLAQKSGVDHSTISRLVRGDRVPSLRTAAMLARSLDMPAEIDQERFDRSGSPAALVEYALRSDDLLNESGIREIMNVYLAARRRRPRSNASGGPAEMKSRTPVPIVVEVPGLDLHGPSIGRVRTTASGRSR
jgi:transcriptional regulator with XRE-family HTH domain